MRLADCDTLQSTFELWLRVGEDYNEAERNMLKAVINEIKTAPTVDAVPVVRCKDCKHYKVEDGPCPAENASDSYYSWIPDPDWFCADGERVNE